jgi:hypothetical protein
VRKIFLQQYRPFADIRCEMKTRVYQKDVLRLPRF